MKRSLCILLSVLFTASVFYCAGINFSAAQAETVSAYEFADSLGKMLDMSSNSNDSGSYFNYLEFQDEDPDFETCRIIVKSSKTLDISGAVNYVNGYNDLWIIQYDSPGKAKQEYEKFSALSYVEYAEPDRYVKLAEADEGEPVLLGSENNGGPLTMDTSDANQKKEYISWGPASIEIDRFNNELLEKTDTLNDVRVAVIDSGVDYNHEFLKGRVIPTNINTSGSGTRNSSMDDYGHGTQVAGVIADATLDNVKIVPYKVLNRSGQGTLISVAAGINCAVNDDVDIINISLGFYESSDVLKEAVENALANDIIVIAAAGNDATNEPYYPSSYDGVLRIAASNRNNVIANFSNYGPDIDFAAPGVRIVTTNIGGGFVTIDGTSFAAPLVSGLCASFYSFESGASSEEIIYVLNIYAVSTGGSEAAEAMGNGIVHAPELTDAASYQKAATPVFREINNNVNIIDNQVYYDDIDLTISCETPGAEIYYTTDKSIPSRTNHASIKYDGTPIHISESCNIYAVAYANGYYRSAVASFISIIAKIAPESDVEIDENGIVTAYHGSQTSLTLPKTVNSVTVTGIGDSVFKNKNIKEIVLPRTVKSIGNEAFGGCPKLERVVGTGVTQVGESAFDNCVNVYRITLGNLESIGKYAFRNTGSSAFDIYSKTFSLSLMNLSSVPEGAFSGSALSQAEFGILSSIGVNSFSDCDALVNLYIKKLGNMPSGAFRGCISLRNVYIGGLIYVPVSAFNTCVNLYHAEFPDAEYVYSNAFENCVSLENVELPKALTVYSNAFNGCDSLIILELPSMTSFESSIYLSPDSFPLFPKNLTYFSAPKLERTVRNMFITSPDITYVILNSANEIEPGTFNGCQKLFYVDLQNVTELKANSMSGCAISFIDLRNLVKADDLPDNSGVMLSNKFLEASDSSENLTVYGTPSTFVQRYAQYKGYDFVSLPVITNEIPGYITSESEMIYVSAVGFNLEYQWYENTESSTETGTPIEGATQASYTFTQNDTAPFFYCVITQTDFEVESVVKTPIIVKDTTPADYSAYNEAVERANSIDRSLYKDMTELDEALSKNITGKYSCEQDVVDAQTKAIDDAIANLRLNVAEKVYLFVPNTNLMLFEGTRISIMALPENCIYDDVKWESDNRKAFVINDQGYVRCVGSGSAIITATVLNPDGTTISRTMEFEHKLSFFGEVISFFFRWIVVLLTELPREIITKIL